MKNKFAPPKYKNLKRFNFGPFFSILMLSVFFFSSCVQEPEAPIIKAGPSYQVMKIKSWFEENKQNLRLPEKGINFRTESQELILPFFEKEPNWDKFHHYFFPYGREVYEISLENFRIYYPKSMVDSLPGEIHSKVAIQNIMFIKHPTEERFDPLIARYYPENELSIRDFESISYVTLNEFWSGKIEIFTYDENHFITFVMKEGELVNTINYGKLKNSRINSSARIQQCRERTYQVVYYTPIPGTFGIEVNSYNVSGVVCGTSSPTPIGGTVYDGTYYYGGIDGADPSISCSSCNYTPPSIPAPEEFIINQLNNPCAVEVFKELAKGSRTITDMTGFSSLNIFPWMLDLFRQGGKFNYQIEDVNLGNLNAKTLPPNSQGTIIIQLDNNYVNNATSLSIARTIIHETVHAYMVYISKTDLEFRKELNNYYQVHNQSLNDAHHGMMSQYLLGMAVSLYNWDKKFGPTTGNLGFDYY